MSQQVFSLSSLNNLRKFTRKHLAIPVTETMEANLHQEVPEPESIGALGGVFRIDNQLSGIVKPEQWFISTADAGIVLRRLPGLYLKTGYRLITYLYHSSSKDTTSITWAISERLSNTLHLEAALVDADGEDLPPYPEGAARDYMKMIEGSRTPASFITASLFQRELQEFGHSGKFQRWGHHHLITGPPRQGQWQWQIRHQPASFSPRVRLVPSGKALVEFYTYRAIPPQGIFHHVDRYTGKGYMAKTTEQLIARRIV